MTAPHLGSLVFITARPPSTHNLAFFTLVNGERANGYSYRGELATSTGRTAWGSRPVNWAVANRMRDSHDTRPAIHRPLVREMDR